MAKNKSKSSLPKRIGGVKVPKSVRKGRLAALLASPKGQEILVGSLVALSGALAGKKVADDGGAKKAGRKMKALGLAGAAGAGAAGTTLSFALGEAARSFIDALHHGPETTTWTPDSDAATPKKKSTASTVVQPRPDLDL
jgi:hypothetical protein